MNTLKRYLIFATLMISTGCTHFNFAPRSAYLNDNSLYFNDSLKLSIQLPGDFILYSHQNKNGIRLKSLCKEDKNILNILGLTPNNSIILFTGAPDVPPFYNLIGVVQDYKDSSITHTVSKQKIDDIDIGTGIIPFGKKMVKLIYYNKPDKECPYCDIDWITTSNRERISAQIIDSGYYNDLNNCAATGSAYNYTNPPAYRQKKKFILEAYTIDQAESSKKLYSYCLLDGRRGDSVTFKLCAGNYLFKLRNLDNKTLADSSVVIKDN